MLHLWKVVEKCRIKIKVFHAFKLLIPVIDTCENLVIEANLKCFFFIVTLFLHTGEGVLSEGHTGPVVPVVCICKKSINVCN